MRIYLYDLDVDVWLSEYGMITKKFEKLARKEIMRGLSKAYIEKVICFNTAKEIWDESQSIYEEDMQVMCQIKNTPYYLSNPYSIIHSFILLFLSLSFAKTHLFIVFLIKYHGSRLICECSKLPITYPNKGLRSL